MARPSLLPPADVLQELRDQGWRLVDIAEQYEVTISAVQKALKRAGWVDDQVNYTDVVPWTVARRLANSGVMQKLRYIAKQKQGLPLTSPERFSLEAWLRMLNDNNLVLDYHENAPPNDASSLGGWYYRTRVPEDQSFYREPHINDKLMKEGRI